ncbi:hypothetical protein [Pedobacter ginsengisoli]|uniref:hypothetical protein n=1 Tax=Pedobacter ginsengisoli TaxID=363852 RepID=UPI00254D47AF|nr:hypothetical protein [Pedobacter ginsengisoli]
MQELEYYDILLNIVEQDQFYDPGLECEHMRADMEAIKSSIKMRLIVDPDTVLNEQNDLKKSCLELLLRLYGTSLRIKTQDSKEYGKRVMKNMVIMTMTHVLEDLFVFFKDYGDLTMKEL